MQFALLLVWLLQAPDAYGRGVAAMEGGDREQADRLLSEAVRLAPENAAAWKALGVVRAAGANYGGAEEPFRKACRLQPSTPDACFYWGRTLYLLDRHREAIPVLEDAAQRDSRPWRVQAVLAGAREALGESEEAEKLYRRSIKGNLAAPAGQRLKPDEDPQISYGLFLLRRGDLDRSVVEVKAAAQRHPNSSRSRYELGRVLALLGKFADSAPELEEAVRLGYGPAAHLALGRVYLRLGRKDDAHRELALGQP